MNAKKTSQDVLRHANKLHAIVVEAKNESAITRLNSEASRWAEATTDAVVVGDIKRGKSSLINAVVGRTGLLPVDADVATAVHLAVRFARPEEVQITLVDPDTAATTQTTIDPSELVSYASMHGDASLVSRVTAADVGLDLPLLEDGLTIVDTPGVGGMTRGHRDITMAALQQADLLVFVVSCVEPVSRTELEFLSDASERIGNVVLVATRSDLGTTEANQAMLADLTARIGALAGQKEAAGEPAAARRLRRLAELPPILTSAYLAEQATRRHERGRIEQAAALREQSGIDALAGRLQQAVEAREFLRLANLLQLMSSITAQLQDEQTSRLRTLDGDTGVEDELKARGAELEAAAGMQAKWRGTLATGISRMQTGAGRDVSRELTLVRDHYRNMIDEHGSDLDLDAFAIQLQQSLQAAWANLSNQVSRTFDDVIKSLLDDLSIDSEPGLLGELAMPPGIQELNTRRATGDDFDLLDDALPLATQSFMFGNIANAMVGVLGLATGGLGLMAYGIGAAISAPIVILRRKQRQRRKQLAEVQRALNEALFGQEGIAREFTTELTLRILDARQGLEGMIEERLSARRKDLEQQRRALQELMRSEMSTKSATRQEVDRKLGELKAYRAETERLTSIVDSLLEAAFRANPEPDRTSGVEGSVDPSTGPDPAAPAAP